MVLYNLLNLIQNLVQKHLWILLTIHLLIYLFQPQKTHWRGTPSFPIMQRVKGRFYYVKHYNRINCSSSLLHVIHKSICCLNSICFSVYLFVTNVATLSNSFYVYLKYSNNESNAKHNQQQTIANVGIHCKWYFVLIKLYQKGNKLVIKVGANTLCLSSWTKWSPI